MEGRAASGARRGIEYRYPLLNRRVLEFVLGLPPVQFRRGKWSPWLMRHVLRPVLSQEVYWHPSKADSARYDPLRTAFIRAVPVVQEEATNVILETAAGRRLGRIISVPSRRRFV